MKRLGSLILLFAAAATGIAAYFGDPQGFLSIKSPFAKIFLVFAVILFSNLITTIGIWSIKRYAKSKEKSEVKQLTSVFKYIILIILVFMIAIILYGIIGPVITSIGLLAAGLTLALQRPILNMGGWFLVVTKRPYRIGDRVDIGSISGFVHEISLMHTHLSLVDKEEPTGKVVYIPNEQALTQPIINFTRGSALVWDAIRLKVPVSANLKAIGKELAECAVEVIGKDMKEAAKQWRVDIKPEVRVSLEYATLKPYVEVSVRYLCNAKSITAARTEITKKIIARLSREMKAWQK